jgi:uncharacterized RDD family membrane protein YckC
MADSAADARSGERGGFWRRVLALLIDAMLISLLVGIIGVPLYGPTGGAIRVSSTFVNDTTCTATSPNRPGVRLPMDFTPTGAGICVRRFFGLEHDRTLIIQQITKSGAVTYSRVISLPVDAEGRVVKPFYLDNLTLVLIAIYLFLLEWLIGTTIGKRILGLRVRSLDGARITLSQSAIRTLSRMIALAPIFVFTLGMVMLEPTRATTLLSDNLITITVVTIGWILAFFVNFAVTVRRGNLPWYDQWAGTEVVRFARDSKPA